MKWVGSDDPTLINDERFAAEVPLLAKSKADFAFVRRALNFTSVRAAQADCGAASEAVSTVVAPEQKIRSQYLKVGQQLRRNRDFTGTEPVLRDDHCR